MTKLNKEQYTHFLKGGYFTAEYQPTRLDIPQSAHNLIGKTIEVYPNWVMRPSDCKEYLFQMQFNCIHINGWIPEEDLINLEIINEFHLDLECEYEYKYYEKANDFPYAWMYKMIFLDNESIYENFGDNVEFELPFIVYRSYCENKDSYVINELCFPFPHRIERMMWKFGENNVWKKIFVKI